jgi:hypothetical protein
MEYSYFFILLTSLLLVAFYIAVRVDKSRESESPVQITVFILVVISAIVPWFIHDSVFDFDEPVCIEHVGYVKTEYSWKRQERTFDFDGDIHSLKRLMDYSQLNVDSLPDSVMVYQYIYDNWGFIKPSRSFFIYSENPTKYIKEGACKTEVQTK